MGPWGRIFPRRGFWALHPGPRAAKPRVWGSFWRNVAGSAPGNAPWAVGGNFCPTASGGVRARGSRARGANSAGIHVFSRRARPAPGPRNPPFRAGAGGAGGGRARKGAPSGPARGTERPAARGVRIASGQAMRLCPKWRRKGHRAPPAPGVSIASGQATRLRASQSAAWFCRRGAPSQAHTRQGLRDGCPEERAPRVLAIIPTNGPTRLEYKKCKEPKPERSGEPSGVAGTKACGADVRKNARRARWNRHQRRRRAALHFLHRCVI